MRSLLWIDTKPRILLDLGCGPISSQSLFCEKALDVVAIDTNRGFLEHHPSMTRTHLVMGDATSLPIPNDSVDAVVANEVLEHVDNDSALIVEARRVLHEDGHLILTVPNDGLCGILDPNHFGLARAVLKTIGRGSPSNHRHYSIDDLKEMLGGDFRIVDVARTGGIAVGICVLLVQASKLLGLKRWQKVFNKVGSCDYRLEYGAAAYNLAISARKMRNNQSPPATGVSDDPTGRGLWIGTDPN